MKNSPIFLSHLVDTYQEENAPPFLVLTHGPLFPNACSSSLKLFWSFSFLTFPSPSQEG